MIRDSVDVIEVLKPVFNFKASDEELPWKKAKTVQENKDDYKE